MKKIKILLLGFILSLGFATQDVLAQTSPQPCELIGNNGVESYHIQTTGWASDGTPLYFDLTIWYDWCTGESGITNNLGGGSS